MPAYLNDNDILQIAKYTRISLSDSECKSMTKDLNDIVDSLQVIRSYDLEGVEPTFHPIGGLSNIMREDAEEQSFTVEEALKNAPSKKDNCFEIPSILGSEG